MALVLSLIAGSSLLMAVDGHYYMLFKNSQDWDDASDLCEGMGATLATWDSQSEYDRIVDLHDEAGSSDATWIGLHDTTNEGKWEFVDGDTTYCDNYDGTDCDNIPQWADGEPNDAGTEDCASIRTSAGNLLNDKNCGANLWFVCEFSSCTDMVVDYTPPLHLPAPGTPVNGEPNYFVLDFASGEQGMTFLALAVSNLMWAAVAVYYFCVLKEGKAKVPYSKVIQFSEDERLNA